MNKRRIFLLIGILVIILLSLFFVASDFFSSNSNTQSPDADFSNTKIINLKIVQQDNFEKYIDLDISKVNDTRFQIIYRLNETLQKEIEACNLDPLCFNQVRDKYKGDVSNTDFDNALSNINVFPVNELTSNLMSDSHFIDLENGGVFYIDLLNYDPNDLSKSVGEKFKIGFNSITIETVESTNDVGQYASVALDSNGVVYIMHFDDTNNDLRYCNNSGGSWNCEKIFDVASSSFGPISFALDSNNFAHLSFINGSRTKFTYCNNSGGSWSCNYTTIPGDTTILYNSIALDSNNIPHFVQSIRDTAGSNSSIIYFNYSGGDWGSQEIIYNNSRTWTGSYNSMAIDSNGIIHTVFYEDYSTNTNYVRYCNNSGGSWNCERVGDSLPISGNEIYSSTAIDSKNVVHFSIYDQSGGDLRYCNNSGGSWSCSLIDSAGDVGVESSLAIDSSDKIFITYIDVTNVKWKYCTNVVGYWECSDMGALAFETLNPSHGRNLAIKKGRLIDSTSFSNSLHFAFYNNSDLTYINIGLYSIGTNIKYPLNQSYINYNSSVGFNFTIINQTTLSQCIYNFNTTNISITNCQNTSFDANEGNILLQFWVNDSAGNVAYNTTNFTIDLTNPTLKIISPSNNTNTSNTGLDINYTASDTNLASCWYGNDSYTKNTTLTSCTNLTTITWSQGKHNVTIYTNDSAGNQNSSTVTFLIDSYAPRIDFNASQIKNNSYLPQNWILVNISIIEENFRNSTFYLWNSSFTNLTNYTSVDHTTNFTALGDGYYLYNVTAFDYADNSNFTQTRNVTLDTLKPFITNGTGIENNNTNFSRNWIFVNVSTLELNFANITFYLYNNSFINATNYTSFTNETNFTNLLDGTYYYNVTIRDLATNENYSDTRLIRLDNQAPIITVFDPDPIRYPSNETIPLNFTSIDQVMGISQCWFQVINSSGGGIIIDNESLPNCQNSTFNTTGEGLFNFTLWSNDTLNQLNLVDIQFEINLSAPAVVLDYPTERLNLSSGTNVYLNFTATDSDGLDQCQLWGNWTGWHLNYTWDGMESGVHNFTQLNFDDGDYLWNVWCNDTSNNNDFALNNQTFTIDTISPTLYIESITTTAGSQIISFNTNSSDTNLKSCKYSIYNLAGGIDGANENISMSCNTNPHSATVSSYATFNLTIYSIDYSGNENYTSGLFTTSATAGATTTPGGGSTTTETQIVDLGFCGDKICNSERGEDYYSCPQDCTKLLNFDTLNFETLVYNCFDGDESTNCFWSTNLGLVMLFIGFFGLILLSILFEYKPERKGFKKLVYTKPAFLRKRRKY